MSSTKGKEEMYWLRAYCVPRIFASVSLLIKSMRRAFVCLLFFISVFIDELTETHEQVRDLPLVTQQASS